MVICGADPIVVSRSDACSDWMREPTKICVAMPTAIPAMMSADCTGEDRRNLHAILSDSMLAVTLDLVVEPDHRFGEDLLFRPVLDPAERRPAHADSDAGQLTFEALDRRS